MTKETPNPNGQTPKPVPHSSLVLSHSSLFRHWSFGISHSPLWLFCLFALSFPATALAHPLGNESINHITLLWVLPDRVEFDLFLDFAETPSQPFPDQIDTNQDGQATTEEQKAWLKKKAADYIPYLTLTIDGQPIPLTAPDQAHDPLTAKKMIGIPGLIKMNGVAGMPTYRTLTRFVGPYPKPLSPGEHVLTYEDTTFGRSNGLKRVVLEQVPAVQVLDPHPPFLDPEGTVFLYDQYDPANLPQERRATIKFRQLAPPWQGGVRGGVEGQQSPDHQQDVAPLSPPRQGEARGGVEGQSASRPAPSDSQAPTYLASITDPRNDPSRTSESGRQAQRLIDLLQGRWGFMVFLTVTALSFAWGAAHALMPGHAKTVVAAYLISRSGNYWHAVVLAIVVTITHTALVVVLGLVIWLYQASHPALGARLQLWLGIIAGLLVALMGLTLIWRALTGRIAHHHHDDGHHAHDPHDHGHHGHASACPPLARGGQGGCEDSSDSSGIAPPASLSAHDHPHTHEHTPRSWFRKLFTHSHPHFPHEPAHHHPSEISDPNSEISNLRSEIPDSHSEISNLRSQIPHHSSPSDPLTLRMLILLGITGGIVPCPTATIILLLGIGANVVAGALYAVGVFSLGLALTLMLIGFLALSSRRVAARIMADARRQGELSTTGQRLLLEAVPALSGALVVALGLAITANYIHHLFRGQPLITWLG